MCHWKLTLCVGWNVRPNCVILGLVVALYAGVTDARACSSPTAVITNLTFPLAGTLLKLGDTWQINVTAPSCPSAAVTMAQSQNGGAYSAPVSEGTTNSSGSLTFWGSFATSAFDGSWTAVIYVAGVASPTISFQVASSTTVEYIYAGDRALAELHTAPLAFSDVAGTSFAGDANLMFSDGITGGCGSGLFCASSSLTRAQMAFFIIRSIFVALNGAGNGDNFTYSTTPHFTDVPVGSFGFQWIQKMFELGITGGCSGGLYCPNSNTSNYDTLVFVVRGEACVTANAVNNCAPVALATSAYPSTPQYFADTPSGNNSFPWAQYAVSQNIISTSLSDCTPGNFCGTSSTMTRSLSAMWMVRGILGEMSY